MCIFVTNILFLIFRMAYVYLMRIDDGTLIVILDFPAELHRAQADLPDARINIRATRQRVQRRIREAFKLYVVVNRSTKEPIRNVLRRNGGTLLSYSEMRMYMKKYSYRRIRIGIVHTVLYNMKICRDFIFTVCKCST